MKILAFDLSTRQGSIALASSAGNAPDQIPTKAEWPNDRRNSAPFFRALDQILRAHGPPDRIVVGLGPGSYTGTRIAISAAIGLQITSGAEVCGLPSVCAISPEKEFIVIGDAKRASFFLAQVSDGSVAGEIELLSRAETALRISKAELPIYTADDLPQFDRAKLRFPRAELLCHLVRAGENLARAPLEPFYLRPPHITSPRNR